MHIKDLKTGAGKSGSHAVSGPEVGGGHRMGEGFAVRALKEPHQKSSARGDAASELAECGLKVLSWEVDEGVPDEDPDLPVVDPKVRERREPIQRTRESSLGLLDKRGHNVDALGIGAQAGQESSPVTRAAADVDDLTQQRLRQCAMNPWSCSFALSTDPNSEMYSGARSVYASRTVVSVISSEPIRPGPVRGA